MNLNSIVMKSMNRHHVYPGLSFFTLDLVGLFLEVEMVSLFLLRSSDGTTIPSGEIYIL